MKKLILVAFAFVLVLGSCDITDLNENEKDPTDVPADPLFSNAQVAMSTFLHNTNVNLNIFKLISQQWTTTTYTAEPRYELDSRGIPDNVWIEIYRDVLIDLKEARLKIEANEVLPAAVKANKLGSIQVMRALAYSSLVNIFGTVPYEEALNPDNTQPTYTDGQTIYMDLLTRLDTAISNFDASADGFGSADVFYNGDISKWIKFANSLKLRLAITIADVNPSVAQTAIEEAAPNAFTSNADNALVPFQSSPPNTNPVWEALVQSGRQDYLPAAPLVSRMNNLDDPRRPVFFTEDPDPTDSEQFSGGVYGQTNDYINFSHFSALIKEKDRAGVILGYDEVEFILAEAAERGYNVSGTAATHYNAAIRADMEYWGVPDAEIAAYLVQLDVAYTTAGSTFREKIGTQKWFALFMQGLQAWTEVRRLDEPDLQAPPLAPIDTYPKRFTYPADEQIFNQANYSDGASSMGGDMLTTPIFWDVN
jgi:hypothetical protein